jgi:RHH-type proline utilization regulon transcriptional repressor/proline dehydrogenase/delta 1-pyrroline-5-carboxylate dehydrogenase
MSEEIASVPEPHEGDGPPLDDEEVEREIRRVGGELWRAFPSRLRHPLKAVDQQAMRLSSSDLELKAALFRLVDVTPATRGREDLARHLAALVGEVDRPPAPLRAAMRLSGSRVGRAALGAGAGIGVRHMAQNFIIGESPEEALPVLRKLWDAGAAASVDLLGEATVTQAEADRYAARCDDALARLAEAYAPWPERPILERDGAGPIARANVSVKVSALTPLLKADAPELGREDAARRLRPLLRVARDSGAHLHVDMESLDTLETTMELVFELLEEPEFRSGPSAGLVLQAYLRDSPLHLDRVLEWARGSGRDTPPTVRLVKGAYWDHEVVDARQQGWSAPVFEVKAECDRNFETLSRRLLHARPRVRVAIASHNLRSVAHAIAVNRLLGGHDRDLELQVLRGLGDELQHALAASGFRVRAYCPVGDLVAGMAYLVRRLLENTSNDSFLDAQARGTPLGELLAAP